MAMLKDSLITGDLRVTGTIYGKATNAVLADEATAVRDKGNGTLTYLNYGASGMTTTSWIGSWDGYTLKAISPANLKTTMALNNVENTKLSTWAGSGNITTIGTLTSGTVPWARLSGIPSSFTPAAHTHGNITNDGKIGTTANQAAYTTTNGVVTTGTLPAAAGGTGKTTLKDAANALINALDTGSSALTANDYVITQYVGGGTTTTTYHRRPASALRVGGLLTARTFTIGSTGKTFDGTGNVSWTLAEIGAAAANHNHDSSYVNVSGDTMTGALTLSGDPTSAKHAATKQYVDQSFAANDAMIFKGTIGSSGATVTALPATHSIGWTYRVLTAGTYAGVKCEVGDLIICITDGTSANNAHWTVAQTNLDGAVIGPASATSGNIALFDGTTGKLIKNSSYSPSSFATAGHTHPTTLATDTGTSSITLASAGKYKLTAGGNSVIFTMPTSNNYTHPTSAGNKHIPSGGEDNQILAYGGSSGTAKWENLHTNSVRYVSASWAGDVEFQNLTEITSWTTNTPTQVTKKTVVTDASVSNEILTFTTGDSVTVTAGTAASLNYNNYRLHPDYCFFYDSIGEPAVG